MKSRLLGFAALFSLVAFAGCEADPTGGRTETNEEGEKEVVSFELNSISDVTVTQGKSEKVDVTIDRDAKMTDKITVTVGDPGIKGVTITPKEGVIQADSDTLTLTVTAAGDAEVKTANVEVSAKPEKGKASPPQMLKVTVEKAEPAEGGDPDTDADPNN